MLKSTQFLTRKEMKTGGDGKSMKSKSICFLFLFLLTKQKKIASS
jgi:hypothetical protein